MIEITLTTIAAYGSFAAAEHFHWSGVIATVTAGMLCGNYAARTGMSPATRIATETFWEYLAFALNSFVFLLIGFEVRLPAVLSHWRAILVAWLAVTLGRAIVTFAIAALLRRTRERIPWSWAGVMAWGGLRGGLSMVLVLALPREFPHREFLVTLTFGVVVVSILLQGLTMGPLLRRLGLVGKSAVLVRYEEHRVRLRGANAALAQLGVLARADEVPAEDVELLKAEYEQRRRAAMQGIEALHLEAGELREEHLLATRRSLLLTEKQELVESLRRGEIGTEAYEHLAAELDAKMFELEGGHGSPAGPSRLPPPGPDPTSPGPIHPTS
jgi:CPA1 family monovalent cation:H+ antiporter